MPLLPALMARQISKKFKSVIIDVDFESDDQDLE